MKCIVLHEDNDHSNCWLCRGTEMPSDVIKYLTDPIENPNSIVYVATCINPGDNIEGKHDFIQGITLSVANSIARESHVRAGDRYPYDDDSNHDDVKDNETKADDEYEYSRHDLDILHKNNIECTSRTAAWAIVQTCVCIIQDHCNGILNLENRVVQYDDTEIIAYGIDQAIVNDEFNKQRRRYYYECQAEYAGVSVELYLKNNGHLLSHNNNIKVIEHQ